MPKHTSNFSHVCSIILKKWSGLTFGTVDKYCLEADISSPFSISRIAFISSSFITVFSFNHRQLPSSCRHSATVKMMGFFTNRYKLHVHIFQIVLVVGIVGLTVVRMFNRPAGMPSGRSSTMALGMVCLPLQHTFGWPLTDKY